VPTLRTTECEPLANPLGYYTANRLRDGQVAIGGTTRLPRPDEKLPVLEDPLDQPLAVNPAALAAGEKIYRTYCVACHQPNGRGIPGGAADFVGDRTRLAKSDAQLLEVIGTGVDAKGMPAFKAILSTSQRRNVLAYIRATFGEKRDDHVGK
jgi:mono/diheme cytochrome c family protein